MTVCWLSLLNYSKYLEFQNTRYKRELLSGALMPQVMNEKGRQEVYDLVLWRLHAVESEVSIGRGLLQGSLQQLLL